MLRKLMDLLLDFDSMNKTDIKQHIISLTKMLLDEEEAEAEAETEDHANTEYDMFNNSTINTCCLPSLCMGNKVDLELDANVNLSK